MTVYTPAPVGAVAPLTLTAPLSNVVPLTVNATTGQSADLVDVNRADGSLAASFASDGHLRLFGNATGTANNLTIENIGGGQGGVIRRNSDGGLQVTTSTGGALLLQCVGAGSDVQICTNGDRNTAFGQPGSYGGGKSVIFIANATTLPSTNPTGGGVLYVNAGALTYRGSGGTITVVGPA